MLPLHFHAPDAPRKQIKELHPDDKIKLLDELGPK
jgi:hypothetical protein